ncbi:uncharacterized protein LOC119089446 [Pollicipes pollicipes]|uniref:uncharacterized protein LOC119089446 n=1 Tax=Pollicipes pollicipes TaxID=41117 RepID=UPI0018854344|nr:uncharacterized protein LOC119089446 [Pollicipes pollicipes]
MSSNIKCLGQKSTPITTQEYFKHLETSLDGATPENLVNYDETALGDDPSRKKVVVKRGMKYPESVKNHSKAGVSVMFGGSAFGELLPPYVVHKAPNLSQEWTAGGPAGAKYTFSPSESGVDSRRSSWCQVHILTICVVPSTHSHHLGGPMNNHSRTGSSGSVLPYLQRKTGGKAIVGDSLSSHLSRRVIKACKENDISFICLPPSSTHQTQPLDVVFFCAVETLEENNRPVAVDALRTKVYDAPKDIV